MPRVIESRVVCWVLLVALMVTAGAWNYPPAASAADPLQDNTSLAFVPENVEFYMSVLRLGEIYDKVANSKAAAKFQQIPAIQMGLAMAMAQWENPQNQQVAAIKQALQAPENQQLVALLKDAFSQEIFLYGAADFAQTLALINEINTASNVATVDALAAGDPLAAQNAQMQSIIDLLKKRGDNLRIPTLVKGAKLTNTQAATDQLKRLENLLTALLAQQPELQKRFARETIGKTEYLTLRLDGTLVAPLIMQNLQNADPQQAQEIATIVSALKLVISIGLRDQYLIVSIGSDNKHLAQLGQGALLYSRTEMEPLRKAVDKPIVQMAYVNAAFAQQAGGMDAQIDQLDGMVRGLLPAAQLSTELQTELAADLEKVAAYIKAHLPKRAAQSGFEFLTPEGLEQFTYNWTTESSWDASKNLTILEHVGGDPIAFWAARGKQDPKQLDDLVAFVSRGLYYAEKVLGEKGEPQQQEAFAKIRVEMQPLVDRMVTVTREKLIPAFADGQSALVLDAKSTSDAWHVAMPPADEALPMLEIGMVNSVSDADKVKDAFGEYFTITQEMLDKLHELSTGDLKDLFPSEIEAYELARPQTKDVAGATVYYYLLPDEIGLDAQIAPNAGLSSDVMVSSLMPRFTARLLATTPFQGQGPLATLDRPLAGAGHLDFARLIDVIQAWFDYGMQLSQSDPSESPFGDVSQQVHDVLEVLKCFRGVSCAMYQEGAATVMHTQCRFEDLD